MASFLSRQATRSRMRNTGIGRAVRCSALCHLPRFSQSFFEILFLVSSRLLVRFHILSALRIGTLLRSVINE